MAAMLVALSAHGKEKIPVSYLADYLEILKGNESAAGLAILKGDTLAAYSDL